MNMNFTRNDDAVLDLGNGTSLISTADFYKPFLDDLQDFGRIVSANIIGKIYARGGKPISATAILGWPTSDFMQETIKQVLEGAKAICAEAGITLSEEHHINAVEPVLGIAVNGLVDTERLIEQSTATPGCRLYLTKPIGLGILATAQKKGILKPEDSAVAIKNMITLNKLGELFSQMKGVKAMTDVTGIGLLGHLVEICEKSGLSAVVDFQSISTIHSLNYYLSHDCAAPEAKTNWNKYENKISRVTKEQKQILADPQIGGGLLVAVTDEGVEEFEQLLSDNQISARSFGWLREPNGGELIQLY